jgi:hypothetical protein
MGVVPVDVRAAEKPDGWFFNDNHVIGHCIRAMLELVRKKRLILPGRMFFSPAKPLDRNHLPDHVTS